MHSLSQFTVIVYEHVLTLDRYLSHSQSQALYHLDLTKCSLNGSHVASLMHASISKQLHLDVSENCLEEYHDRIVNAIAQDSTPMQLSIRGVEYDTDEQFLTC